MPDTDTPHRDLRTCRERQDAAIADLTARMFAVEAHARAQAANTYQLVAALEALERRVTMLEDDHGYTDDDATALEGQPAAPAVEARTATANKYYTWIRDAWDQYFQAVP